MNIRSLFAKPEQFTDFEAKTPAEKAARVWDEREGGIIVQNANLRKLTVGLMILAVILGGALVYKSLATSVVPYVVEVDLKTGEVRNVGTMQSMTTYEPTEAVYKYFLTRFIKNAREIPLDPVVYKAHIMECFGFMTENAANKFQQQLADEDISGKLGKVTTQINIVSILPISAGSKSYQVRWDETQYDVATGAKTTTPFSGLFTTQIIRSDDEERMAINPIGFYVIDYNWSKDASAKK